MSEILMSTGNAVLPPGLRDFVDQTVDLMKLSIVQGLAAEASPGVIRAPRTLLTAGATRPAPGAAVGRRLRSLGAQSKRGQRDYAARLPLEALYSEDIRSLARVYGVDLADTKTPFEQVDVVNSYKMVTADMLEPSRLERTHLNVFDARAGMEDEQPEEADAATAGVAVGAGVGSPAVARMLSERPITLGTGRFGLPSGGRGRTAGASGGSSTGSTGANGSGTAVLNRGLKLRLHEVKCIDETNPEWPGSDEIGLGGVAVSDTGATTQISEFMVGTNFDDGDRKRYSPARNFYTFSLNNVTYPADFMVAIAMAEKDSGGLSGFIRDLWEAIKDHVGAVLAAVGAAAGAAIGAGVGGTLGTAIGGPLGTIIGIVAGAILGALVGWLISVLQDDIFRPQSVALRLPTPDATFSGGSLSSPQHSVTFNDHGGTYRVYYSWLITR